MMLSIARAGSRLVAVGERGFVLLSDDSGRSWRQAVTPTSVTLTTVRFSTEREGWAAGHMGVILHTSDGGATWRRQLDGIDAANIALVQAQQEVAAVPDDSGAKARLKDAEELVSDGPDKPFLALFVRDARHVLAIGAFGLAFDTEDGGTSWIPMMRAIGDAEGFHLYAAAGDERTLYLFGERGFFSRSEGGHSFVAMKTPYTGTLIGALLMGDSTLIAFGLQGTALRSEDRGTTWETIKTGIDQAITSGVVLRDNRVVLGSQSGQLAISADGGKSFDRGASAPEPVAAIVQAPDGFLILGGPAGVSRMDLPELRAGP